MRRSLLTLTFALLLLIGGTEASAQSIQMKVQPDDLQNTERALTESSAQEMSPQAAQRSVVLKTSATAPSVTRRDIRQTMLADVTLPTEGATGMQEGGNSRRTLLYVAGGTLVAAGITAAIILLTGGDDDEGIPGPPGRPSQ